MENHILDFIAQHFSLNDGYEDNVPFKLEGNNYKFTHVDTEFTKEGITRFQGIISYKSNKLGLYGQNLVVPLWLFPYISTYKITCIYTEISSICYTIWFKEPMSQEMLDNLPRMFDNR